MGTTGPASTNRDRRPGPDFPSSPFATWCVRRRCCSTISALPRCSRRRRLGGRHAGAAMGRELSRRVFSLPLAARRGTPQNIAFHEVGRQAVMADPEWQHGRYFAEGTTARGLAVAHGRAHHYLSTPRCTANSVAGSGPRQSDLLLRRRLPGGGYLRHQASASSSA